MNQNAITYLRTRFALLTRAFLLCFSALALLAPWVPPALCWPIGLVAIAFPWLYLLLLPFTLLTRSRTGLVLLLLGAPQLPSYVNLVGRNQRGQFRILSCNLNYFGINPKHTQPGRAPIQQLVDHVRQLAPDLVCAQDSTPNQGQGRAEFLGALPFPHSWWARGGQSFYANAPLEHGDDVAFAEAYNGYASVDLLVQGKPLRVINLHLQSYALMDWRLGPERMRAGLQARSAQTDQVAAAIASSPHPVIVCGDFNDVPDSYAYRRISAGLQDGFRAAGSGLARTYRGTLPAGRIDYIFASPQLRFTSYTHIRSPSFDDHDWVLAELDWRS